MERGEQKRERGQNFFPLLLHKFLLRAALSLSFFFLPSLPPPPASPRWPLPAAPSPRARRRAEPLPALRGPSLPPQVRLFYARQREEIMPLLNECILFLLLLSLSGGKKKTSQSMALFAPPLLPRALLFPCVLLMLCRLFRIARALLRECSRRRSSRFRGRTRGRTGARAFRGRERERAEIGCRSGKARERRPRSQSFRRRS